MLEHFAKVKYTREHNGYIYSVEQVIVITVLGLFCGLRNLKQISLWAHEERVKTFLSENFKINRIPTYCWHLKLLKIICPESLSECFTQWVEDSIVADQDERRILSFDGKSVRSTGKMKCHDHVLHVISAQIAGLGITLGQEAVEDKSNEIPAVQRLIRNLNISNCIVVADALNCQTETANAIREGGGDYLLCVKNNQKNLKKAIEGYVQDDVLKEQMDIDKSQEKNRGRIEKRTAYVTQDVDWLKKKKVAGGKI